MSIVAAIRQMIAAGLSVEQALTAAEAVEAAMPAVDEQAERRRAKDRERKRLVKAAIPRNSADSAESAEFTPPKRKVSPCTPSKENTPPSSRREASQNFNRGDILAELETSLDGEHAAAVADYRLKGRKDKFSAYAARLLAKELGKAPDANVAAEAMIRNGWQGFDVAWMERRGSLRVVAGADPPKRGSDAMVDTIRRMRGDPEDPPPPPAASHPGRSIDGFATRTG